MQIVHDKVANLKHIEVYLFFSSQEWIVLQLFSYHSEQLLKKLFQSRVIEVIVLEEFVTDSRPSQLGDEIIDWGDTVADLANEVPLYLMRLHLSSIFFAESLEILRILLLRDQIFLWLHAGHFFDIYVKLGTFCWLAAFHFLTRFVFFGCCYLARAIFFKLDDLM